MMSLKFHSWCHIIRTYWTHLKFLPHKERNTHYIFTHTTYTPLLSVLMCLLFVCLFCNQKGDRAYSVRSVSGAYSEYAVSDALFTGHLGDKLTFSQGAAVGVPYYTAYRSLVHTWANCCMNMFGHTAKNLNKYKNCISFLLIRMTNAKYNAIKVKYHIKHKWKIT